MKKRNKRKRSGQRVLSMALSLVLFLQMAPLAAFSAYADEAADAAVQTEEPVNEIVLETAAPESAPEEMTDAAEAGELVTEDSADAPEPTEPEEPENTEEPETEDTTGGSETVEPEVEETTPEAGQEEPNEQPVAPAEGRVEITSAEQLLKGVPAGSTYVLTQNIEMGADQQIGVVAGVLDGAGHTITLNGKPLVGELTGTIQNLLVDGKATQDNGDGSIVRTIKGGTLQNCGSTVNIDPGWAFNLGGLAGNVENGKIYNSFFAGNGKDMFGTVAVNGIFYASNNSDAPSKIQNCYYTEGLSVGSGSAWNREDTSNGKKSLDEMKEPAFVQLLNAANVGSGYVWEAVEGALPKLVPGGSELEPCDKAALEAAIQQAQSKNEEDYTSETWEPMQQALEAAIQVNEKIDATQDEVDKVTQALQKALEALVEKERNLSPVEPPKTGVITIASQEDLAKIDGSDPKQFYQLTQDIVLKDGYRSPNLAGVLDGNGHTITIQTASSLIDTILETGVVQNLHIKVEGNFTNRQMFAPFAETLKGGMIVNCISEVTGQHSTGYVRRMEGGVMVNCLTMGHNRRGAFVYYQKSTDHQNINGYRSGKFYHCYWSASNSVENINPAENLVDCEPVGDERLRSAEFIAQMNNQKGKFGASWGRDTNGYPYFGADKGDAVIDGSNNRYPVQFVWHDEQVLDVKNGNLQLSPQVTNSGRFAGTFRLKDVPEDSTIIWSCDDRSDQEIMQINENGELYVFQDGGGIVRAMERKSDGTEELAAELRVVSASRVIEQLRVLLDGQVVEEAATVQGSAVKTLEIQAKYAGSEDFQTMPAYLVELTSEKPELLRTDYNTAAFYFKEPGTSKLTVTEKTKKENPAAVTVTITSAYVPVKSVNPAISGIMPIHYRNSMGSGQFISFPQTVFVEPANASYKDDIVVTSSNSNIAVYDGSGYTPYKNGTVTFTAKLNDRGNVVEGKSEVTFVYKNPLMHVSATTENITLNQGEKQSLPLTFQGQPGNLHNITEPNLVWTFDKKGIVSIQRPDALMQVRGTGGPDDGNWVASTKFEVTGLRPGTVVATGTPVDTTGGAKPVQLTITVEGDGSAIEAFDIPKFIAAGKKAASDYLKENNRYTFGEEWSVFTLLRDGQTLPQDRLDSYYADVVTNAHSWKNNVLPTDVERTAVALNVMGKDITDVDGINFVKLICNHPDLTRQGSNSLSWALIALDMNNTQIPADMQWSREKMIAELLNYQNEDGGFGLDKTGGSGIDITAMSLQALARYRNLPEVAESVEKAVQYLAKAVETNLNLGNSESIAQVIIAMSVLNRDVVTEPGFGDELENLMSVLEKYMVEGKGFKHDKNGQVDKMATAQAMQALCAYERFLHGESGYWDLQGTGPVEDPAEKVSSMIAALPDMISAENAESIREARDAYEALTDAQKKRVKNLDRLVKAEQALTELQAVQQVVDAIAALPEEITLANAHEVKAAREVFEKLTVQQQAQVTNLKKLEAAEAAIQALIGADRVQKMIDDLPENITLANESAVQAARAAYELLTPQQQAQVTNVKKLEEAEKKLEALHAAQKVQQVVDKIDELPENITLADEKTVQDARTAFDQLTKAQQAQVGNADKLFQAEKSIADQKAAAEVEKMIQDLSDPVTMADKQAVEAARVAYEALTDEQKALVQNLDKLTQAEAGLKDLDAAQKVMNQIKELPVEITADDEQAVKAAREAYQALTEQQQKLVLNLYLLDRAEQKLADIQAVRAVEEAIDALPEQITQENWNTVKAARIAYNQLAPELRKQVRNFGKLLAAEKSYKESLYKPAESSTKKTESNVVKATVKDGLVAAKQLEAIRGKDLILRIENKMESGEAYTLSIYGKDIAKAQDLRVGMQRKGLYEDQIHKLAEDAEIFRFLETDAFPGPMMVEMHTTLADGDYLLLQYDPTEQKAELVTRVQAANGKVQFIVEEGGEYFLAKKASKKSVSELEEAEEASAEMQPEETDVTTETTPAPEETEPVQQQEAENTSFVWIWALVVLFLVCGGFVVVKIRKEKKGE